MNTPVLIATIASLVEVRRDGRVAEGAPLLREYGAKNSIEGSNPSLSATPPAPVAQLDRVPGYELGGREFESLRARHLATLLPTLRPIP